MKRPHWANNGGLFAAYRPGRPVHASLPGAIGLALILFASTVARAGGGGENMLLVVNPNNENALRIANAYVQANAIPTRNIVYLTPPNHGLNLSASTFRDDYITPLANVIGQRQLTNIDYIGVLGQPTSYAAPTVYGPAGAANSLTYGLSLLTPFAAGLSTDAASGHYTSLYQGATNTPTNTAIHHSTVYQESFGAAGTISTQYYMGGAVGFTGLLGNSPDQVITGLENAAAADGAKPTGTIYFEQNTNIRSTTRQGQWQYTEPELTARNIPWVQENGVVPINRTGAGAVRGAVVGSANYSVPNGSTYVPGSWADSLTSAGSNYNTRSQTKATDFIRAGAAATSGSVVEPYAVSARFTNSSIYVQIADGSTLGEAFYKSVREPDVQMFTGDMLAQPYADVPHVSITSGPAQGATVNGAITFNASATLNNPTVASGIKQLQLYVDGKPTDTPIAAASGSFNLDTTGLSDGWHQIRLVALNNAPAESQGYLIRDINVNNHDRSIRAGIDNLILGANETGSVPISTTAGKGVITSIELQQLGRVIGSLNAAKGDIHIDAGQLAYGNNPVVPVALFGDGSQVAGAPINVDRQPVYMPGQTPTPLVDRQAGIKAEYFIGKGGTSIASSDFTGTPNAITSNVAINLQLGNKTRLISPGPQVVNPVGSSIDKLAVRLSGRFDLSARGEYQFFFYRTQDSAELLIDGQAIMGFNNNQGSRTTEWAPSVFLGAGEHKLTMLTSNTLNGTGTDPYYDISLMYRGPDGITRLVNNNFIYQAVPEPGAAALLFLGAGGLLVTTRHARRRSAAMVTEQR